jgi:hypothetical protein
MVDFKELDRREILICGPHQGSFEAFHYEFRNLMQSRIQSGL